MVTANAPATASEIDSVEKALVKARDAARALERRAAAGTLGADDLAHLEDIRAGLAARVRALTARLDRLQGAARR